MAAKIKIYDLASGSTVEESTQATEVHGFRKFKQTFWRKGFKYTAAKGAITLFSEKFTKDIYLTGGTYRASAAATESDTIEFQVVDLDNVLGYGAGAVLAKFIETENVVPGETTNIEGDGDGSFVPNGVYLQAKYTSTGNADVPLKISYRTRLP